MRLHCTASYITGFWIPFKQYSLEGNHFCKVNPEVLGYFIIAVDLERINQMLILSNVMKCTRKFIAFYVMTQDTALNEGKQIF
jgi:hypothetical protein